MAYRTFKGALGWVEIAGTAALGWLGVHSVLYRKEMASDFRVPLLATFYILVGLFGLVAVIYTQILRSRAERDADLAALYFKPLPDTDGKPLLSPTVSPATATPQKATPARPVPWVWTPIAKLTAALVVIAVLTGIFVVASHKYSKPTTASVQNDPEAAARRILEEKVAEINKLAPFKLNDEAEFVQAEYRGSGIALRYNLLRLNKVQVAHAGAMPNLTKYARSFVCRTESTRSVLDRGPWITNEYYDADGLKVTSFVIRGVDCPL